MPTTTKPLIKRNQETVSTSPHSQIQSWMNGGFYHLSLSILSSFFLSLWFWNPSKKLLEFVYFTSIFLATISLIVEVKVTDMFFKLIFQTSSFPVETLNNGGVLLSPPHNPAAGSSGQQQQQPQLQTSSIQITQPVSAPSSPLASPGPLSHSNSFSMPSSGSSSSNVNDTADPNWQATKSTVLERNAAMFNNELMSDVHFVVGIDGKCPTFFPFVYFL